MDVKRNRPDNLLKVFVARNVLSVCIDVAYSFEKSLYHFQERFVCFQHFSCTTGRQRSGQNIILQRVYFRK